MTPGAIPLTLILSSANAPARALVSPKSAVLVTEYGAINYSNYKDLSGGRNKQYT